MDVVNAVFVGIPWMGEVEWSRGSELRSINLSAKAKHSVSIKFAGVVCLTYETASIALAFEVLADVD